METIVIVGGGVSGVLVAANLLRLTPRPLRVVIVDRSPPLGRGVAYRTNCPDHLLNVPAGRMGAYPDEPAGFYKWIAARVGRSGYPASVEPGDFLPRYLYGEYIYAQLQEARSVAPEGTVLDTWDGEVVDIEELQAGARVLLKDERTVDAHRVVLALGNLPGEYPIRRSMRFFHGPFYAHVPWQEDVYDRIAADDEVLLVGAGLTAADVITMLAHRGHRGRIHALSRRGLRPAAQLAAGGSYPDFLAAETLPSSAREMLARVRLELRRGAAAGHDWRSVIDAMRPRIAAVWQGWPTAEKARFLRHLRPYWEAARHRVAPRIAEQLTAMEDSGQLQFYGGRLQSLSESEGAAVATFRRRGTEQTVTLRVAKVINCTGPRTDYSKYQHPLIINLLARGLIDHDPLALGLSATETGELHRYRGGPSGWLLTLGPPLKGVLWECTAVAEIRQQARRLAAKLIST